MTAPYRTRAFDAPVAPFHVVIIGGGIGGLALAQGLKKAGISVAVYERDQTPSSRLQGYRVHINPAGSLALHACLPPDLFAAFEQTCGRPGRAIHFLTEQMDTLLQLDAAMAPDIIDGSGVARHRSVSRITLRQVLLSGLDDVVHFGKTFARYEECAGRIVAHFEDGTTAEGDILVAADGGGSRVRKQYLPQAVRIDTGVVGIAGKVFLNEPTRRRIAPQLLDGIALVSARGGYGLFVATQDYAHVALKDAVRLRDAIVAGESGERSLIDAIQAYEAEMLRYGFAAVRNSLRAMEQTVGENEFGRTLSRTAFRIIDRLPPVKRRMLRRMGDE